MNSLVITLFDHTCLGPFIKLGRLHKQVIPPTWIKILGGFIWEHQSTTQVFLQIFEPRKASYVILPARKKLLKGFIWEHSQWHKFANFRRLFMLFLPLEITYWEDLFQHSRIIHIIQLNTLKIGLFSQFKHVWNQN